MKIAGTKCTVSPETAGSLIILSLLLLGHPLGVADSACHANDPPRQAVNFGGPQIGGFAADTALRDDGSAPWSTTQPVSTAGISNPAPQAVYQTGLRGSITHTFESLTPGEPYTVRVHYAEILATAPRENMSDVSINGTIVRSSYDIFGATGAQYTATVGEYVADADLWGELTVDFWPTDLVGKGVGVAGLEVCHYVPPAPQPTGWWPLDEVGGITAKDAIGQRHGTLEGPARDIGRLGGDLTFDGINDRLRIDNAAGLLADTFSISCWIRGTTPDRVIACVPGGMNLLAAAKTTGFLTAEVGGKTLSTNVRITDGMWHNIWATYDGTSLSLYADGVQTGRMQVAGVPASSSPVYLGVGSTLNDRFWAGSIDDIRIYDRALPLSGILQVAADAMKIETTFYYHRPTARTPLMLNLDKLGALGAVPGTGATEKEIRDFATAAGFANVQFLEPSGMVLLDLSSPLARPTLATRARRIRSVLQTPDAKSPLTEVGMVVKAADSEVPMLVMDQFMVQFLPEATAAQISQLNAANAVETVWRSPYVPNLLLLKVTDKSQTDAMEMANRYHENSLTQYATPDFVVPLDLRQSLSNDRFFGQQWHLHNTGQTGGTVDADIDAPEAWEITRGSRDVVIAIIDQGFDISHPDLVGNLWMNPEELSGHPGVDDDGNKYIDDINGWDFGSNTPTRPVHKHGTAAAGCAGARGNNGIGVTGSCPECSLMLLSFGLANGNSAKVAALDYAWANGADIISNSWGLLVRTEFWEVEEAIRRAVGQDRNGHKSIVFFAMTNDSCDNGGASYDISALEEVIAVSRATNEDRFNPGGYGNCMDVLGPTHGGTRYIATTDSQGAEGYNASGTCRNKSCPASPGEPSDLDYTFCFNGTSAACPIVAGVGGLILSVAPKMERIQVQRLLQDTADKVEPSAAQYVDVNGFSRSEYYGGLASHGYGRVNAFEAVRIVAPAEKGGRGGVDIFLRDNRLDWGNTEQPSHTLFESPRTLGSYGESPDIRIDAPPFRTPPVDSTSFDSFAPESPQAGRGNRIYVRVRNRGPRPCTDVTVKLLWCSAEPGGEPDLPADFWARFPTDSAVTTPWRPLPARTIAEIPYSGSSVAGTSEDLAQVQSFDLDLTKDPTGPGCLLAIVDAPQDPVSDATKGQVKIREITPYDNNVAQRNVAIAPPPN